MKKIISVIGARPQFIKHAPIQLELQKYFNAITLHTGQHYDENMSNVFFEELKMKKPDYLFDIGSSKLQGEQTAKMIIEIEKVFLIENPDAVIIYGDTNSTLSAAIVASKMNIPLIHIEAGLRSFNREMPEEVNRIISDEFSKLLFCPTKTAIENLKKEGIDHDGVILSGDVMCDSLFLVRSKVERLFHDEYYFATLHRPYNTDNEERLKDILRNLQLLDKKVVFAIHPRTIARFDSFGISKNDYSNIKFIDPVGYIDSISYQNYSEAIITDSGGIQKEAYILKKKCITIRTETEWIETLENGWNTLVFDNLFEIQFLLKKPVGAYVENLYGDGTSAVEIIEKVKSKLWTI